MYDDDTCINSSVNHCDLFSVIPIEKQVLENEKQFYENHPNVCMWITWKDWKMQIKTFYELNEIIDWKSFACDL